MLCMLSSENLLVTVSFTSNMHLLLFLRTLAPNYSSLCSYSIFFTYFSTTMKLPYHLPLWFNPHFQCSQSSLHLPLAEINRGEWAPHIYFFIHLSSCRRRCSWKNWGKWGNRNWQWIFRDEIRSTGNKLIYMCFLLLLFLISSAGGFFAVWSDNAVMVMIF